MERCSTTIVRQHLGRAHPYRSVDGYLVRGIAWEHPADMNSHHLDLCTSEVQGEFNKDVHRYGQTASDTISAEVIADSTHRLTNIEGRL
jgi:hypothetical protein